MIEIIDEDGKFKKKKLVSTDDLIKQMSNKIKNNQPKKEIKMDGFNPVKWIIGIVIGVVGIMLLAGSMYTINPGEEGVIIRLGNIKYQASSGFHFKMPFIDEVRRVTTKIVMGQADAPCFSSDLQQVNVHLKILIKINPIQATSIVRDYAGNPFDALVVPRVQEAIKENTALMTAENAVKNREALKIKTLELAKKKIGDIVFIEDIVLENVDLSDDLEKAIESKMVNEQQKFAAKFIAEKMEIEAQGVINKAKGEAEAISIRGKALKDNPSVVELNIVEKWNGISPLVVGSGGNFILPINAK